MTREISTGSVPREAMEHFLQPEKKISPELKKALDDHIVDVELSASGNAELIKNLRGNAVGAAQVEIGRCDPPVEIEKLSLEPGKSIVVIGANGAGKTTVFDGIMRMRNAEFDTRSGSGAALYGKSAHSRENLRIARLNQEEVLGLISHITAREVLSQSSQYFKNQFPVDWEDLDAYDKNMASTEAQQRIDELMSQVIRVFDMEEFLDRNVNQLSGGERTKLVLLTILTSEPDVLLLDEPTNHLDMASIAKLTFLFEKYKRAGVSVVSVSHVDPFLREAGKDGVIEVLRDEKKRSIRQSGAPYERYMKDRSRPTFKMGGRIEWCGREPQVGKAVISTPELITIPDSPISRIKIPSILGGEVVFLLGDNGSGKTKVLEAMRGGNVIPKEKGINLAYMSQFWPKEVAEGTVEDFFNWVKETTNPHSDINTPLFQRRGEVSPWNRFIRELGDRFGRSGSEGRSLLKKPLASFSGGEQRFLYLMAVSVQESVDVLLLDEPTNHMDRGLRELVLKAIQDFRGAVVIATHDEDLVRALAKDAGRGPTKPKTLVLRKEGGVATAKETKNPLSYIDSIKEGAARSATRINV